MGAGAKEKCHDDEQTGSPGAPLHAIGRGSNRHRHGVEGAIAIDQIDTLLHDAKAIAMAAQTMALAAGKDAAAASSRYSTMITVEPTTYSSWPWSLSSDDRYCRPCEPVRDGGVWTWMRGCSSRSIRVFIKSRSS